MYFGSLVVENCTQLNKNMHYSAVPEQYGCASTCRSSCYQNCAASCNYSCAVQATGGIRMGSGKYSD